MLKELLAQRMLQHLSNVVFFFNKNLSKKWYSICKKYVKYMRYKNYIRRLLGAFFEIYVLSWSLPDTVSNIYRARDEAVWVKNQACPKDLRETFFQEFFFVRKIKPRMSDEHTWIFFCFFAEKNFHTCPRTWME